jgi:hypothetical protein
MAVLVAAAVIMTVLMTVLMLMTVYYSRCLRHGCRLVFVH